MRDKWTEQDAQHLELLVDAYGLPATLDRLSVLCSQRQTALLTTGPRTKETLGTADMYHVCARKISDFLDANRFALGTWKAGKS